LLSRASELVGSIADTYPYKVQRYLCHVGSYTVKLSFPAQW